MYGRSRARSGTAVQLCKDFAVGRCRRGHRCPFSHESSQTYEDNWESRQRKAGGTRYSTTNESREYPAHTGRSNESADELIKERDSYRRHRNASLERGSEHEPRRSSDIPCKFFAAGNCRNGKNCRFSHSSQPLTSPSRRSRDDRLVRSHNSDEMEKFWNGPKYNDSDSYPLAAKFSEKNEKLGSNTRSRDDRWMQGNNSGDMEKRWDGMKWSDGDTFQRSANLTHNQSEIGTPDPRFSDCSKDERWPRNLGQNSVDADRKVGRQEAVDINKTDTLPCKVESEKWLGDMEMSPDWNFGVQSSNKEPLTDKHAHITHSSQPLAGRDASLLTREPDRVKEASGLLPDATGSMQPIGIEKSCLKPDLNQRDGGGVALPPNGINTIGKGAFIDLNYSANMVPSQILDQSSQTVPFSSLHSVGPSQDAVSSEPLIGVNINNPHNHSTTQQEKIMNYSEIKGGNTSQFCSGVQPTQSMVSREQLTELTNISASLVQLLGNRQQLPQIYAALNPHTVMQVPLSTNAEQSVQPDAAEMSKPAQAMTPQNQQQYDPLHDSVETGRQEIHINLPGFSVHSAGQRSIADEKLAVPSEKLSKNNCSTEETGKNKSQQINQVESGMNSEVDKINNPVAEEPKKSMLEAKITQENGPAPQVDKEANADEGKKSKDLKGMRAFKFALVEFVKELLKPNWKDGQINGKDAYKNIVKKVVDKVTGTMQGNNIPQTQEKIEQYLSFSKPKLNKLVQVSSVFICIV